MSTYSRIEWTEQTWNPTIGCTKISPGCKHCYAEAMALRLQAMGIRGYEEGFKIKAMPERLAEPLERKKPTVYFVNSMSDLFHEKVPFSYVEEVFAVMGQAHQHTFQLLTKRPIRMAKYCASRTVPANVWLGVSVEDRNYGVPRIDALRAKMVVRENASFTEEYMAADKRHIANAVQVFFRDGSSSDRIQVDYPVGHRKRRTEGLPLLWQKFESSVTAHYPPVQAEKIRTAFVDRSRTEAMPTNEFVSMLVRN